MRSGLQDSREAEEGVSAVQGQGFGKDRSAEPLQTANTGHATMRYVMKSNKVITNETSMCTWTFRGLSEGIIYVRSQSNSAQQGTSRVKFQIEEPASRTKHDETRMCLISFD